MNKPQFTPGPWSSVPYINGRLAIESDGDELTIALIDTIHTVKDKSEQEANALLIASAPDLLAALEATEAKLTQAARAFYGAGNAKALREAFEGWRTTAEAARAAIAKATATQ